MSKPAPSRPLWPMLLTIAAMGFAIRVAAARGGLWLDEAWSVVFARDVATPAGVFVGINHDNNHHLNTIWLQLVGVDAPPLLQRALSIVSGTAAIPLAGLIAARRGRRTALLAATLFAMSPILVTYGSEARGYAPMLLILLLLVLAVDRWLERPNRPPPVIGLTVAAVVGMLAQMTMIFGLAAVTGWVVLRRLRDAGWRTTIGDALRTMVLPLGAACGVALGVTRWLPGTGGFRVGSYQPFHVNDLAVGQGDLLGYTLGLSSSHHPVALVIVAGSAALAVLRLREGRGWFYALAIGGLPLGMAAAQIGNAAIARYYLVGAAALLLMVAELIGPALHNPGWRRVGGILVLALILGGSLWRDHAIVVARRADPAQAISAMRSRAPHGTSVSFDRIRAVPVLEVAAAQSRYPLSVERCGAFLFVDRDGVEPFPAQPTVCGARYRIVAGASPVGLSGTSWQLYARL